MKWLIISLGATTFLLIAAIIAYNWDFRDKITPNIYLGQYPLGGLNKTEAKSFLAKKLTLAQDQPVEIRLGRSASQENHSVIIKPTDINLKYNPDKTLESAWRIGRDSIWPVNLSQRLRALIKPQNITASFNYSETKLQEKLNFITDDFDQPKKNAALVINEKEIIITPENTGRTINQTTLKNDIRQNFAELENISQTAIVIQPEITAPTITTAQLTPLRQQLQPLLAEKITLTGEEKDISLKLIDIKEWLELLARDNQSPRLIVNQDKIKEYSRQLAERIDRQPRDGKLTIQDGRATVFAPGQNGRELDQDELTGDLEKTVNDWLNRRQQNPQLAMTINIKEPAISDKSIDNLGIKELIGQGTTSYKNSPANRQHNIAVGTSFFNGQLIKPGEILSAVAIIGDVSAARGFLPELVIKEDRTIPEYGGGLCQISTTLFRAALNAGLEIKERQNHSYRVSYYEPPIGMDATIYLPRPDLKIVNDTPEHILIQTKVNQEEMLLTFEIYGTKDGRTATSSDPVVYDFVDPGEPIYEPTDQLAEGETKQVEKSHQGASAYFEYTVTKDGQVLHQQKFTSKYKAWPARYLIGTKKSE